ncbi:hypothetical protein [Pyramidobacter piscolens]|uniref:hypothetical protein n=1 Tax=Pyramidobacter piscolens TaxID=638849 RepID=UPI001FCADD9E|nr:hypothetical protein [Pyramidobacter piscolens]
MPLCSVRFRARSKALHARFSAEWQGRCVFADHEPFLSVHKKQIRFFERKQAREEAFFFAVFAGLF